MYHYCEACERPLTDMVTAVQIQSVTLTRMADGSARLLARMPRQYTFCANCGRELDGFVEWLRSGEERARAAAAGR